MTTPAAPTTQTRQQLEELDALLQRMLSLPLSPAEQGADPKPLPPSAKVPVPLPPAPPVLLVKETPPVAGQPNVQAWRVEMPSPKTPVVPDQVLGSWSAPVNAPVQDLPTLPANGAMVFGNGAATPVEATKPAPAPVAAPVVVPTRASAPPLPVWVWPFYLLNLVFDLSTYVLGPFTRWLSYPATKHVLGWLGVMMLLLSLGFAISLWLGFDWGSEVIK